LADLCPVYCADVVYGHIVFSDDIFLPKEVECTRMDDFEREIEEFKRLAVFGVLYVAVV